MASKRDEFEMHLKRRCTPAREDTATAQKTSYDLAGESATTQIYNSWLQARAKCMANRSACCLFQTSAAHAQTDLAIQCSATHRQKQGRSSPLRRWPSFPRGAATVPHQRPPTQLALSPGGGCRLDRCLRRATRNQYYAAFCHDAPSKIREKASTEVCVHQHFTTHPASFTE